MRYSDLVIALVLQSTILGEPPNGLKVVGSLLVMSTVGSTLYKQNQRAKAAEKASCITEGTLAAAAAEGDGGKK